MKTTNENNFSAISSILSAVVISGASLVISEMAKRNEMFLEAYILAVTSASVMLILFGGLIFLQIKETRQKGS